MIWKFVHLMLWRILAHNKEQLHVAGDTIMSKISKSLACNFAAKLMFVIDILILLTVSDTLLLKNLVVNPVNI